MTDTDDETDDRTESEAEGTSDTGGGIGSLLRGLLETITDADSGSRKVGRGRTDIGRARIGHDFSIGVGPIDDAAAGSGRTPGRAAPDASDPGDGPVHVRNVEYNDDGTEALVALDVSAIEPEELAAGVSSRNGDLLVGTEERIAERVPLRPAHLSLTATTYKDGVLEAHLTGGDDR
jgi:hypothetical protein